MSAAISDRIQRIAADVFNLPVHRVTPQTSPENVENWDSFQHLNLVLALEQELGVEFPPEEIEQMKDIAAIVRIVQNKLAGEH